MRPEVTRGASGRSRRLPACGGTLCCLGTTAPTEPPRGGIAVKEAPLANDRLEYPARDERATRHWRPSWRPADAGGRGDGPPDRRCPHLRVRADDELRNVVHAPGPGAHSGRRPHLPALRPDDPACRDAGRGRRARRAEAVGRPGDPGRDVRRPLGAWRVERGGAHGGDRPGSGAGRADRHPGLGAGPERVRGRGPDGARAGVARPNAREQRPRAGRRTPPAWPSSSTARRTRGRATSRSSRSRSAGPARPGRPVRPGPPARLVPRARGAQLALRDRWVRGAPRPARPCRPAGASGRSRSSGLAGAPGPGGPSGPAGAPAESAVAAVAGEPDVGADRRAPGVPSTGTWTAPAGVTRVLVEAWGAGGAGGPGRSGARGRRRRWRRRRVSARRGGGRAGDDVRGRRRRRRPAGSERRR